MKRIAQIIEEEAINTKYDDLWSDTILIEMIFLFEKKYDKKEFDYFVNKFNYFTTNIKVRICEVILNYEKLNEFDVIMNMVKNESYDIAEVVYDNLRFWNLSKEQRTKLDTYIKKYKNKSPLLDQIISNENSRHNI